MSRLVLRIRLERFSPGSSEWPSDYSAGDIRYATISFAISREYVFSVGPSISDPRSGEIIDADIGFAQEWVKAFTSELGTQTVSTSRRAKAKRKKSKKAAGHTHESDHKLHGSHSHQHHHDHIDSRHGCERLSALMESRSMLGLSFGQNDVPEKVLGEGLADVTTHEVGKYLLFH